MEMSLKESTTILLMMQKQYYKSNAYKKSIKNGRNFITFKRNSKVKG